MVDAGGVYDAHGDAGGVYDANYDAGGVDDVNVDAGVDDDVNVDAACATWATCANNQTKPNQTVAHCPLPKKTKPKRTNFGRLSSSSS